MGRRGCGVTLGGCRVWHLKVPRWLKVSDVNQTLWRTVVTGPEDPKLAIFPSSFAAPDELAEAGVVRMVFDSMPPKVVSAISTPPTTVSTDESEPAPVEKEAGDQCAPSPKYTMFQTATPLVREPSGGYSAQGVKSQCGKDAENEKNWVS